MTCPGDLASTVARIEAARIQVRDQVVAAFVDPDFGRYVEVTVGSGASHRLYLVGSRWYVWVYSNVFYEVPPGADLVALVLSIVARAGGTPYAFAPEVTAALGLRELPEGEWPLEQ